MCCKELSCNVSGCISASATTLPLLYSACHMQILPFCYFHCLDSLDLCFCVPKWQLVSHGWWESKSQVLHENTRCPSTLKQLWMPKGPLFLQSDRIIRSQKHRKYYKSMLIWQALSQRNWVLKVRIFLGEGELVCWYLRMQVQQKKKTQTCIEFFFWQKWV